MDSTPEPRPHFADLAPILSAAGEPDVEALAAIQERYQLTVNTDAG